jgi:pyruvate carboxylase subunit B
MNHEIVITLMELPPGCTGAHTVEFYRNCLEQILKAGIPFNSVCFKDASGTATPFKVHETIRMARRLLPGDTKLVFHTHETAGCGTLCYKAAIEAGADQVDLSMAPISGGTCQPDIATLWHALRGTDFELDVDIDKVLVAEKVLGECLAGYFMPPEAKAVEPLIPWAPMPGGALTANTQMLRDNHQMDKYMDCIRAMGEVVRRGGYGTSVTPVSQFYFQQAFNNVMFGSWKKIAEGYGKMVLGYFGKTPVPADPEIVKLASEQLQLTPTTEHPLDLNDRNPKKGIAAAKTMLTENGLTDFTDETIFIAATCQEKGIAFLKGKGELGIRKHSPAPAPQIPPPTPSGYTVKVNDKIYSVQIKGQAAIINGKSYDVSVTEGMEGLPPPSPHESADSTTIPSPMNAKVIKLMAAVGHAIQPGQVVCKLEAMKMEIEVRAPLEGTLSAIHVTVGQQVKSGQPLATIN